MCCLGQVARQCGIPVKSIKNVGSPAGIEEESQLRKLPKWLVKNTRKIGVIDTSVCGEAMKINDNDSISDAGREKKLASIFAKHGDELEFIN